VTAGKIDLEAVGTVEAVEAVGTVEAVEAVGTVEAVEAVGTVEAERAVFFWGQSLAFAVEIAAEVGPLC